MIVVIINETVTKILYQLRCLNVILKLVSLRNYGFQLAGFIYSMFSFCIKLVQLQAPFVKMLIIQRCNSWYWNNRLSPRAVVWWCSHSQYFVIAGWKVIFWTFVSKLFVQITFITMFYYSLMESDPNLRSRPCVRAAAFPESCYA